MKLKSIYVSNFLGAAAVDLQLEKPVHLFAGRNGAGKSSLRDAVALALTADLGRVSLKKDAPQLVHEGADGAACEVVTVDGDTFGVTISATGKITDTQKGRDTGGVLPFVLDAQRFARLDATERRAFLYDLMGVKIGQADIAARLKAKGCDEAKVQRVLPLLRAGFDAACKQAKANATEAKGAWRAITGETYGSQKAATWAATIPPYDAEAARFTNTKLQAADVSMEAWHRQIGALQQQEQRRASLQAKLPALDEQASKIDRIKTKLAADEQGRHDAERALNAATMESGQAPRVGLIHELAWSVAYLTFYGDPLDPSNPEDARAAEALQAYEQQHGKISFANDAAADSEALARLPELRHAFEVMERAVAASQRDLAAAQHAADEATSIRAELAEEFDAEGLADARAQLETIRAEREELVKQADTFKTVKATVDAAGKKTQEAKKHAEDVAAWDQIGDALSPDGIPAEILAAALGPINGRLAQAAADTGWPVVCISPDMAIQAGERDYRLLSESEKWRVDAVLAEAIASLSGARLLVLDRFDVLDVVGRGQLLDWLDVLADMGEIDTALVFGTLKAEPNGLPESIATHWIENGVVGQLKQAA